MAQLFGIQEKKSYLQGERVGYTEASIDLLQERPLAAPAARVIDMRYSIFITWSGVTKK